MRSRTDQFDGVFSRGRFPAPLAAAILGIWVALAPASAAAQGSFWDRLWRGDSDEAAVVDPLRYTLTFDAGTADPELKEAIEDASGMLADEERPVSGSLGLLAKARSEREQIVAALYAAARYDGVVVVSIAGTPLDEIPLDATFGAGPVPVSVRVTPGAVFTFGEVAVGGDSGGLAPASFGLLPGAEARSGVILEAERAMVRVLKDEGRPLARVVSREVVADHDTDTLDVSLTLAAGPIAPYGQTTVAGTETVDNGFTAYMAGLEPGRIYSPEELEDARRRLNALEVFNSVTIKEAEALDASGAIPIEVAVSERKHRYFGVGATISSTDGGGIEGYWGHRNLFGRAEKLRIEGSISRIGKTWDPKLFNYNAGILFEKPGVMGPASRFTSSLHGNYENPDAYNKFSIDGRAGVAYDLDRRQSVSAEARLEWSRQTDSVSPIVPRRHLLASIPLQYVFDGRDDRLDPTKGVRLLAAAEPTYDIFSGAFFVKARGEASAYQSFDADGRVVLAGRLAAGSILGAPLAAVPADRRFYAGGGGSVRGYGFQRVGPLDPAGTPTGGLSYAEASVEMRFRINDRFGIVPFVDAGTVSAGTFPDFSTVQFGAGLGFRYLTPFGPLRIDAAVPLNPRPGDPSFGIYAGIGQAF
jgi:translocation and assembly module TamA